MGNGAAREGDLIKATDTHTVVLSDGNTQALTHPFSGKLDGGLSDNVKIMGMAAATVGSTARNSPEHTPAPPGASFSPPPPSNQGKVDAGSASVLINGKGAARDGDAATTCTEGPQNGKVTVAGNPTVLIG